MISMKDRYRGTLVGVLAGDALGAPYETMQAGDIRYDFVVRGGLVPFEYPDPWKKDGTFPPGRPTDDSELTAALAHSLVTCRGMHLEDQYQHFKSAALESQSFLWDGPVKGFGGTTRKTLAFDTFGKSLAASATLPRVPSNGSLMRSAPIALFFRSSSAEMEEAARQSSRITHRHEDAVECCVIFARVHSHLLQGVSADEAIAEALSYSDHWHIVRALQPPTREPVIPVKFGDGAGGAVLTLQCALWALATTTSFEEGITKVVGLGGDTDTYGAVAGALLGAYHGVDAIPQEWLAVLKGRERMEELADSLLELANAKVPA